VTVNGNGWAAITAPAAGNGITINAGSGNVALTGLEIDGAGAAYNGIVLNSAANFTVTNCTLQNFPLGGSNGNGIVIQPTSGSLNFAITNTTISNIGFIALSYSSSGSASATGPIQNVSTIDNYAGITFGVLSGNGSINVTISNSVASNNSNHGIIAN